jgi:hypothetical protein
MEIARKMQMAKGDGEGVGDGDRYITEGSCSKRDIGMLSRIKDR